MLRAEDLTDCSFSLSDISESPSPGYYETSEYMIGSVAVGVILPESNGQIDPSSEDWQICDGGTGDLRMGQVEEKINSALTYWEDYNYDAHVDFRAVEVHRQVPTSYEPINHPTADEGLWIGETMAALGYPGSYYWSQVRDFTNHLRDQYSTDWAFTIFVVDSFKDPDGEFTDTPACAYTYLGGPFLVMTYDNGHYGINNMNFVAAHEIAHIFRATDEYDHVVQNSGYLNASDTEYTEDCLMGKPVPWWTGWPIPIEWTLPWGICTNTQNQLGWRDTNGNGIPDIVDTYPTIVLNPYEPNPTNETILTFTGYVVENPYPNQRGGRNITVNTITSVWFSVDGHSSSNAVATDGTFDDAEENFTFTTSSLPAGNHTITVQSFNSVGNMGAPLYATVTTTGRPSFPSVFVVVHKILCLDPIEGESPISFGADWSFNITLGNQSCYDFAPDNADNVTLDWAYVFSAESSVIDVSLRLEEQDTLSYPDLADISSSFGGGMNDFLLHPDFDARGAVFQGLFDLESGVFLSSDLVQRDGEWFVTSGDFDGSINIDENDAAMWFTIVSDYVPASALCTLTMTTSTGGTTDPSPGVYSHATNSSVQVTAIPDAGYIFDHWELDSVTVGSENPYTVLMNSNHTLTAGFRSTVSIGDLNGDGEVDIFDAILLGGMFGRSEGDPDYNVTADLNSDGAIDIFDAVILGTHFGEKIPG